jgi:enoyl-CoA hydratase/carnithine racemase
MSDAVLFEVRDDGIAVITLPRPEARNALGYRSEDTQEGPKQRPQRKCI